MGLKKIIGIFSTLAFLSISYGQCSGSYTTVAANCQTLNVGNGTAGFIQVCLDVDNILSGTGGNSCSPGCGITGGGINPQVAVYDSGGNLIDTWQASANAGDCITVPVGNGLATIAGYCLTAGTQFSWTTIDACGQDLCSGPVPTCYPPGACDCANPCGPACGWTTTPTVAQVTASCPEYEYIPPIGTSVTSSSCYTFVANNTTVDFNVVISSDCGVGNVSSFSYDLYTTGSCGSPIISGNLSNLTMTPLVVGQSYTFCYTFTTPGCTHTGHYPYFIGAVPLTVEFIDFSAVTVSEQIELEWNVASEYNNSHYILERSRDGKNFVEIGQVEAAGMVGSKTTYKASDHDPIDGVNYYRLSTVDLDESKYQLGMASSKYVSPDAFEANQVFVYNLSGTLVKSASFEEGIFGSNVVESLELENGVYLINMFNRFGEARSMKKVVSAQ